MDLTGPRLASDYVSYLARRGRTVASAQESDIRAYLHRLERMERGSNAELRAIESVSREAGNTKISTYIASILERPVIAANIRAHMQRVLGSERAARVFADSRLPHDAAPPEAAVPFTRVIVERLLAETDDALAAQALCANAHGIPAGAFAAERARYLQSGSLEEYLDDAHERAVAELAQYAKSGDLWHEQVITDEVVAFVSEHREILCGVPADGMIYWTKIPYDPSGWLAESDPERKRFLTCHCPMAREALRQPGGRFPRPWCNCSAGFVKQRFDAVFEADVRVDLLESVLDGDDRCRFAIHVPEDVPRRVDYRR